MCISHFILRFLKQTLLYRVSRAIQLAYVNAVAWERLIQRSYTQSHTNEIFSSFIFKIYKIDKT